MPRQKTPKGARPAQEAITDPRFSSFTTDPRFRLPSKKNARTKIDKRFSRMLEDDDFANTAKVDRYGRKLSSSGKKKALERLYQPAESEDEGEEGIEVEDDEVIALELEKADVGYDAARGGGFSSSSEDEDEDEEEVEVEDEESEFPDLQTEQAGVPLGEVSSRIAIVNLDWDNIRAEDLMVVMSSFVRPGGKVKRVSVYQSEFGKERLEREQMEGPPKEIFQKKPKEEEEEEEDSESDSEDGSEEGSEDDEEVEEQIKKELLQEDDGKEYDNAALRQYQLERLRYYYAVMECSDKETARHIYEATDGTEYLSSANFFDLRFIPDGTEFDEQPRDECDTVPQGYKPTDFVTDALRQSKVKLTWDAEDSTRKDVIKKAFSGSRAEIGENDLRAYLGSDTSDSEEELLPETTIDSSIAPTLSKKELARLKMREALGLPAQSVPKSSSVPKSTAPVGDMQITFSAGLSSSTKEAGTSIFANAPIPNETTAEAYIRREKERKTRRREKARALREGRDPDIDAAQNHTDKEQENEAAEPDADLGFEDPFFTADETAKAAATKAARKESRRQRRIAREEADVETSSKRAELELLMADNSTDAPSHLDHFDINEIARAEKLKSKGKKGKLGKAGKGAKGKMAREMELATNEGGKKGGLQEGFEMDVADERFKAVFERHEFAIDPSHPRFGGTEGMKKLLEEGRRKRKDVDIDDGQEQTESVKKVKKQKKDSSGNELQSLVQTLKKRSKK